MSTSLQQPDMQVAHNKHLGKQELGKDGGSEANAQKEDKGHDYKHCKIHDEGIDDDVNDVEEIHREVLNVEASSQIHEFTIFNEFPREIREIIWKFAINTTLIEVHEDNRHLTPFGYSEEGVIQSSELTLSHAQTWGELTLSHAQACGELMLKHAHTCSEARWIVARKMFRFGGEEYKHLTEQTMDQCICPVVGDIAFRKVGDVMKYSISDNFSERSDGLRVGVISDERKEEHAKHLQKLLEA